MAAAPDDEEDEGDIAPLLDAPEPLPPPALSFVGGLLVEEQLLLAAARHPNEIVALRRRREQGRFTVIMVDLGRKVVLVTK